MTKLKPPLQEGVRVSIEARAVIGGAEHIGIGSDDFLSQGLQVIFHFTDIVFDGAKAGDTASYIFFRKDISW